MNDSDPARQLRTALRDLRIELSTHTARVADIAGLNDSDLAVLDILAREGACSPTTLSRRTGMHPATMTAVLRRLVRAGWVTRRTTETDRRSAQIEAEHLDRLADIYRAGSARVDEIAGSYTAEQQEIILTYLRAVTEAIRAASDDLDDTHRP
jgi:DNA-binding MarR family transcriptional regulator